MGRDMRIGDLLSGPEPSIRNGVRCLTKGDRLKKVGRTPRSSKKYFTVGNRPNLKSSLRVREEVPGTGLPVGLTARRRIGYIAEVIGEETQSVGPLVRGPALKEENDTSSERILDNQSCLGVSSLIHRRQAAVRRNCPKLQAYQGWRGRSGERTGSRMNRSPQFQPKRGIPHVWRSGNPERSSHRETRVVMSWT